MWNLNRQFTRDFEISIDSLQEPKEFQQSVYMGQWNVNCLQDPVLS